MSINERPKRKSSRRNDDSTNVSIKRQKRSKELSAYFKSYKNGLGDWHLPLFKAVHDWITQTEKLPVKVLYPGCYNHITTSLVFDNVVFTICFFRFIDSLSPIFIEMFVLFCDINIHQTISKCADNLLVFFFLSR